MLLFYDNIYYLTKDDIYYLRQANLRMMGTYNDYADECGCHCDLDESEVDITRDNVEVTYQGNLGSYRHKTTHLEVGVSVEYPISEFTSIRGFCLHTEHLAIKRPVTKGVY